MNGLLIHHRLLRAARATAISVAQNTRLKTSAAWLGLLFIGLDLSPSLDAQDALTNVKRGHPLRRVSTGKRVSVPNFSFGLDATAENALQGATRTCDFVF
jgi:hypothetical protein